MNPSSSQKKVLILCTGNSCRSQMAEVMWNQLGGGRWHAVSAGSKPSGYVHPLAIRALEEIEAPTQGLVSKSSDQFMQEEFDLVVTVCDNAKEACPNWPGAREVLHWPFEDPADATGTEDQQYEVFRDVRDQILETINDWMDAEELV